MRWNFWTGFIVLALLILGFYLLNPLGPATLDPRARIAGYVPYQVPANSMAPTLQTGDYILSNVWAYVGSEPERGDVVVFVSPVMTSSTSSASSAFPATAWRCVIIVST